MVANKIDALDDRSFKIDDRWTLKVVASGKPLIRQKQDERELLVPLVFKAHTASIELSYDW